LLGGSPSVKSMRHARSTHRFQRRTPHRLRRAAWIIAILVFLAAVYSGVQWFRPVPPAALSWSVPSSLRLAGTPPSLPMPGSGESLVSVQGLGTMAAKNPDRVVPIASITKVMTAYVILRDHPLAPGAAGPSISISASDVAAYKAAAAQQQSVIPVSAGETLTELQALEGLLIPSANNMAQVLARWDAGSEAAFVAKMNSEAAALGLSKTHFADASGINPGSVSTASDLVSLAQDAMADPTFAAIVAMPQVTLPVAGLEYNFDYDLGHDGIIGVKTGSDGAAGGCFLFEARKDSAGHQVTIVGAVLGQGGTSPLTTALSAAEKIVSAAASSLGNETLVSQGQRFGRVSAPWGPSVPVVASKSASMFGWPGLVVSVRLQAGSLRGDPAAGERLGTLTASGAGQKIPVPLDAAATLPGPTAQWRLTRL
jgi:D-alanyl-D-alanine carboxypeptidase (penicillin-binding protein 5/6)